MDIFTEKGIQSLIKTINELHRMAFEIYKPIAEDLCSKIALSDEVEHTLDCMLDFCGDDAILTLFKKICRHYANNYPDVIKYEVLAYKEMYE